MKIGSDTAKCRSQFLLISRSSVTADSISHKLIRVCDSKQEIKLLKLLNSFAVNYEKVTQKSKIHEFEVDLFGYLSDVVFKYSILAK